MKGAEGSTAASVLAVRVLESQTRRWGLWEKPPSLFCLWAKNAEDNDRARTCRITCRAQRRVKGGGHLFKNEEHETEGGAFLSAGPCPALRVARSPRSHPWPVRRRIPNILSGRAVAQAVEMSGSAFPQIHVLKRQTGWPSGLSPLPVGTVPVTRRSIRICTEQQEKGPTLTGLQSSVSAAQKTQTHPSTSRGGSHVSRVSLGT